MFKREHHRRIEAILEALDAPLLMSHGCLFGGGTAIALKYSEYRESNDVDFIVSDISGYRELRARMSGRDGINGITRAGAALVPARDVRADQYGIRTRVTVGGVDVKFEIVIEGRIALAAPTSSDRVCGVATLTELDMATTKLLANADRWPDDAVNSRDVIDLAMMHLDTTTLNAAKAKSSAAYGDDVERSLHNAIDALRRRRGRLEECIDALRMTTTPAQLWVELRRLLPATGAAPKKAKGAKPKSRRRR